MYESFFGFTEKPFSLLPDPDFLYLGKKHSTALSMLQYGLLSQAGFTVITGEIGAGKTTLIRHILNQVEANITVGLISNTHRSFGELLQWVLMAFGMDYKGKEKVELFQCFNDFLINEYANGRTTVLIIDEAQNMDLETLEELRMLSNINADKDQVIQLILVGQPELRRTLMSPQLEQFAQRISIDYHLGVLSKDDAISYIRHRLTVAGGNPDLFEEAACKLLYYQSRGTPRLINSLCDTALVYAFGEGLETITEELVREVIHDRKQGGLFGAGLGGGG